jgi:hypothetical protein
MFPRAVEDPVATTIAKAFPDTTVVPYTQSTFDDNEWMRAEDKEERGKGKRSQRITCLSYLVSLHPHL